MMKTSALGSPPGGVPSQRVLVVILVTMMLSSCRPDIEDDAAIVRSPRVLAVRAEPAEAKPNEKVSLALFYTDGARVDVATPASFRFCTTRRALSEPGPLDPGCLDGSASVTSPTLPRDACRAFGPDRPLATKPGEPSGRPSDPDSTGGFYQPGIVQLPGAPAAMFEVRLRCALPSVTQDVATAFEQRYRPNQNPEIAAVMRGAEVIGEQDVVRANVGEEVHLSVSWPALAAEGYVAFDVASRTLVDRREAMTVSWLASGGIDIPIARTGRGEADQATSTDNKLRMPSVATDATLFIVLRDSRGGVAFTSRAIRVR